MNFRCWLGFHDWTAIVWLDQLVLSTDPYKVLPLEGLWECERCGKEHTGMPPLR